MIAFAFVQGTIEDDRYRFWAGLAMATSKSHGLQLTRAVDPNAIAIFLNYRLQSQGMTARVVLKQSGLQILLEASQTPPQQTSVELIRQAITSLRTSVAHPIKIYGRIRGRQTPSWSQQLNCSPDSHQQESAASQQADSAQPVAAQPDRADRQQVIRPAHPDSRHQPTHQIATSARQSLDTAKLKTQSSEWFWILAIGGLALLMPLGLLLIWSGASGKLSALFPATASTQTTAAMPSPSPAAPTPQPFLFQEAINKAMQAATRTQSAKNRQDWQQVSSLWQDAIVRLEQVLPTDAHYATAQQKMTEYQGNFVYAQQRLQAIPTLTKLGITQQAIQSRFQDAKTGFQFSPVTAIDKQPRVIGYSANGLAMLELIGAPTDLSKVTIVIGLPDDDASARALNRIYMLRLLQLLIPEWQNAADWLSQSTAQLADGYTGDVITIRDGKRIKLSAIGAAGTLVLVVEPNG